MLDGESEREKPMRWGPEDPAAAAAEPHFTRDEPAFAPSRKGLPPRRGGGEGSGDEGGAGGGEGGAARAGGTKSLRVVRPVGGQRSAAQLG